MFLQHKLMIVHNYQSTPTVTDINNDKFEKTKIDNKK